MDQIVTKAGRLVLLDKLSGFASPGGLAAAVYHLFTNNVTPTVDSVTGDFTDPVHASLASQAATGWGAAALGVADVGQAVATPLTWTNLSGGTVNLYGFYVTDGITGAFLFAARFDSAPQPLLNNQALILTPQFQDTTIYTS